MAFPSGKMSAIPQSSFRSRACARFQRAITAQRALLQGVRAPSYYPRQTRPVVTGRFLFGDAGVFRRL
jgi:hypothetical protein